ncbi:Hsp70 family protein [Noviherbaspirillum sp. CPCC 100848]|uniref:Hsp70 family protein n=1 Tax=Noviherbaspirillum album TaxID=3080276 RepID=A0ABU6JFX3_9BURK|nr:Hsp70 family protein [Noviherbaspirillum sp. CPCC 100848]MEC4722552.1 Hsp70 family protein [Noviherbaspirillum sp. CPCC 100848]
MKRYRVGIDLGTTNTVVAYAEHGSHDIRLFDIEQLTAPGEVKAAPLLPSLRFHAAPGELAPGDLQLPWTGAREQEAQAGPVIVGALARKLGAQVPGRLVASAKSWLSHAAVDRLAPILPWGAGDDVLKVSPVEASASYLAHVRAAWNLRFPDAPLEQQDIVLTVPASFDESARALTVRAAAQAGLATLRLLEEPQAAFYDWVFRHRANLAAELAQTRLVLVCDVGGGTTDLSLIKVELQDGLPQLTRIGVGKHLMLGGDNMDLVLAHVAESRMQGNSREGGQGGQRRLSATELSQLLERCRSAKEQLLASDAPEKVAVTLLGAGSRLIGGSRSIELTRDEALRIVVDGFFPLVEADEPVQQRRSGIVEFGLPYASDPAVTRHLAAFLAQFAGPSREALGMTDDGHADVDAGAPAIPDTLLLNGGVFRAPALASRLRDALGRWRGQALHLLHNDNPDVAVARGAVAFALAREGLAPRIGGGSPRSYFLMLDERSREASVQAKNDTLRAVCVLPKGSEQGRELLLEDRVFALRLGRPVRFHLMSSTVDRGNRAPLPGELVELAPGDLVPLPPIATVLPAESGAGAGAKAEVPVRLATALTEVGTLEMHCVSTEDAERRWLLEFQLREVEDRQDRAAGDAQHAGSGPEAGADALPARIGEALERIDRIFGSRSQKLPPKEVRQLRAQLEKLIGGREQWSTPVLRKLFDALLQRARARRRSADHERVWLNLAGYCLRPGFGYPLDDWRIDQLWAMFDTGIQYVKESQVATEWWTLWRRVAGGLDTTRQLRLLDDFAFNVQDDEAALRDRPPHLVAGGYDDMLRLAGSLERIPASYKTEIGDWLLGLLDKSMPLQRNATPPSDSLILWTLARIGARRPFQGAAHEVVAPDIAAPWLERLLALDWKRVDGAALAAAHIARSTGDRVRDVPADLRGRVVQRLKSSGASPSWADMVEQTVDLDEVSQRGFLGDSLPPGLKLIA